MIRTFVRGGVVLLALVAACKKEGAPASAGMAAPSTVPVDPPGGRAPAPAPPPPTATAPAAGGGISGTVVETMDASTYTYARLDHDGTQIWVAGPQTKIAVGTRLGAMQGELMTGFKSDTLKRTFDQIYFVSAFAIDGAGPAAAAPPAAAGDELSGTVVETMNAAGYTYAQLDHAGTKIWVAGPETKLAVGTKLGKLTGQLMTAFKSDTLKRTFDQIYFIGGWGDGSPMAPAHPDPAKPAVAEPVEKVPLAKGGKTVADIIANKAALAKTAVVVRGKVVKVNNGILGKNWVHLRDGSGAGGAADILVTSSAEAKLGDVVVARGTVALDQDFGAGYKYDVLIENAAFASE